MLFSDYFLFFGAVSLLLGILGFMRAKSVASLIAGGISGIGLAASAVVAMKQKDHEGLNMGYVMALILSVLLLGRFMPGFLKSKKFYPAGIMALLSLIGVAIGIAGLLAK